MPNCHSFLTANKSEHLFLLSIEQMFYTVNPMPESYITVMLTLSVDAKISSAVIMPNPHLIRSTPFFKITILLFESYLLRIDCPMYQPVEATITLYKSLKRDLK